MGLALLIHPHPAPAEPADTASDAELAAARSLFEQARDLEKEGRWAEALEKLEAVGKVRMTPQVRFHIALCHMRLGRLVAARNGFTQARREARRHDAQQVIRESNDHIESLEARIPSLRIQLEAPPAAWSVSIDGDRIERGLLQVPIPLDPGDHRVTVVADGYEDFERSVTLDEGVTQTLTVSLRPRRSEPGREAQPVSTPAPTPSADHVQPSGPTLGWILVGTGGALLLGAAGSALAHSSAVDDIEQRCPSHTDCDPALEDTHDRAQTYGALAAVLGGVGVATLGAGGFVVWTSSGDRADESQMAIRPVSSSDGFGMAGVMTW